MNMVKPHIDFEEYVSRMEGSLKEKTIIAPYIKGKVVIDFGAGSGSLDMYLKTWNPSLTIYAIENDTAMFELLQDNPAIEKTFFWLDEAPKADTIIFNSVLHEIYSYGDYPLEKARVRFLLAKAAEHLNPGGRIIIRDGFKEREERQITVTLRKSIDFDVERYIEEYSFGGPLVYVNNQITGEFNDVKEFLNKLTWGMKSLDREIHEQVNCFTEQEYQSMLLSAGMNYINIMPILQPSYFYYLNKVAEITSIWNTHILIIADKGL